MYKDVLGYYRGVSIGLESSGFSEWIKEKDQNYYILCWNHYNCEIEWRPRSLLHPFDGSKIGEKYSLNRSVVNIADLTMSSIGGAQSIESLELQVSPQKQPQTYTQKYGPKRTAVSTSIQEQQTRAKSHRIGRRR
eukprot:1014731_1